MARLITTEEIMRMIKDDERFVLLGVLENAEYEQEHICSSINIAPGELKKQAPEVLGVMNEKIVVYGSGPDSSAGEEAAGELASLGYKNVLLYRGGLSEWTTGGHCTEGAAIDRQRKAVS